jgi:hypothetical protein
MLVDDDRQALVAAVRDVADAQIGPLTARPESPPDRAAVDRAIQVLTDVGVLTGDAEPGLGVWDAVDDPDGARLSADLLGGLALHSPGIAYEVHGRALAAALDRAAGREPSGSSATFEGSSAVGGRATGRALAGAALSSDDRAMLDDVWGAPLTRPRVHVGPPGWDHLWWPEWSLDDGWRMRRACRQDVIAVAAPHGHGLDELVVQACTVVVAPADRVTVDRDVLVDALAAHAVGLLAISTAAARRSIARSRGFSLARVQGGQPIGGHDAVAQLLARAEAAASTAEALVAQVVAQPPGLARLHQAFRARALAQPILAAAGSDALQVLGGLGYMRDVGAEKDQRDLNTLRRLGGSPPELMLRCAALDDGAGRAA